MKNCLVLIVALACGSVASSVVASYTRSGPDVLSSVRPFAEGSVAETSMDFAAEMQAEVRQFVDVSRPLAQQQMSN